MLSTQSRIFLVILSVSFKTRTWYCCDNRNLWFSDWRDDYKIMFTFPVHHDMKHDDSDDDWPESETRKFRDQERLCRRRRAPLTGRWTCRCRCWRRHPETRRWIISRSSAENWFINDKKLISEMKVVKIHRFVRSSLVGLFRYIIYLFYLLF